MNRREKTQSLKQRYGGLFPFPSQWITVFAVACDDYSLLLKRECELGLTQARMLYEIGYCRRNNQVSDIANSLCIQRSTASGAIKQLKELGLIDETSFDDDKRSKVLAATDRGIERLEKVDLVLAVYGRRLRGLLDRAQYDNLMTIGAVLAEEFDAAYQDEGSIREIPTYLSGAVTRLLSIGSLSKRHGLKLVEARLLAALVTMAGKPRISTLGSRLSLRSNEVTVAVDSLERMGLVRRSIDSLDARAVRVSYTDAGYERCAHIAKELVASIIVDAKLLSDVPFPITSRLFPNPKR